MQRPMNSDMQSNVAFKEFQQVVRCGAGEVLMSSLMRCWMNSHMQSNAVLDCKQSQYIVKCSAQRVSVNRQFMVHWCAQLRNSNTWSVVQGSSGEVQISSLVSQCSARGVPIECSSPLQLLRSYKAWPEDLWPLLWIGAVHQMDCGAIDSGCKTSADCWFWNGNCCVRARTRTGYKSFVTRVSDRSG